MYRLVALCLLGLSLWLGAPLDAMAQRTSRGNAAETFRLAPHRPGETDIYILSFGLWGPQSVFDSEARGAARVLETAFASKQRTIVRANTKRAAGASAGTLMAAARSVGAVLDPAEDVAIMVLTSHGGPEGIGLVTPNQRAMLTPRDVGKLLDATKAHYRVLIVSACYSGIFTVLADPNTLVITAAAADRSSFGCRDGATWTYFGDAFFNRSLRREPRLDEAFGKARAFVTEREKKERFEPSNPQIAGGALVLRHLSQR